MSCCDKCAKTGGNCGPSSQQPAAFDDSGELVAGDYRGTLGPRGMMAGVGDPTNVSVSQGGATPTWELALIAGSAFVAGLFANQMYRRRHGNKR